MGRGVRHDKLYKEQKLAGRVGRKEAAKTDSDARSCRDRARNFCNSIMIGCWQPKRGKVNAFSSQRDSLAQSNSHSGQLHFCCTDER